MKFFVYGTLKEGGYFAKNFDTLRKSSVAAKLNNFDLFRIGDKQSSWFPGIKPGTGTVVGEIHEYANEKEVLRAFDMIEGYSENKPRQSLYIRETHEVELEDGTKEEAIVYVFNGTIRDGYDKLDNGVWQI